MQADYFHDPTRLTKILRRQISQNPTRVGYLTPEHFVFPFCVKFCFSPWPKDRLLSVAFKTERCDGHHEKNVQPSNF